MPRRTISSGRSSLSLSGTATDLERRILSAPRIRRVAVAMERSAQAVVEEARKGWPISRGEDGRPLNKRHSRDMFRVTTRLVGTTAIEATVYNDAPGKYGYMIRSRQVGETPAESFRRFKRKANESAKQYAARSRDGRRKNAWKSLVLKPGNKRVKALGQEIAETLTDLAGG